jgi:hypothetical protein
MSPFVDILMFVSFDEKAQYSQQKELASPNENI